MQPTANRAHWFRGAESGAVASHTIFVRALLPNARLQIPSRGDLPHGAATAAVTIGENHGRRHALCMVGGHLFRHDIF